MDDSKYKCVPVAAGKHHFMNISAEQEKPLSPTLAIPSEISFYLFFIILQQCMPAHHKAAWGAWKHSFKTQNQKETTSYPKSLLYRWQNYCLGKCFSSHLIKIFPLRWTGFSTENSITNRAKPISSPIKLVHLQGEKNKNKIHIYLCTYFTESQKYKNISDMYFTENQNVLTEDIAKVPQEC